MAKLPYTLEHNIIQSYSVTLSQDENADTQEEYVAYPADDARGVSIYCRESGFTLAMSGSVIPCRVLDGETIAVFDKLSVDSATGYLKVAATGEKVFGTALGAVTNASDDYISLQIDLANVVS